MNRGIFSNIAFPIPSTDCRIIVCQWDRGIYETYMFYISIIFLHISYKKENIKILSNTIWHPWVLTLQQPSWMVIFFWLWISEIHANIFKVFQFPPSDKIFPICPAKYSAKLRTSFQLSADRHNNTHIGLILDLHLQWWPFCMLVLVWFVTAQLSGDGLFLQVENYISTINCTPTWIWFAFSQFSKLVQIQQRYDSCVYFTSVRTFSR